MKKATLKRLLDRAFFDGKNDEYESNYKEWRNKELNKIFKTKDRGK